IGNTDRHSENWGFLIERDAAGRPVLTMAPAFDNGTSLGFIIGDRQLADYTDAERLKAFIDRGHHHFGWKGGDKPSAQHITLCGLYAEHYPATASIMRDTLAISDSEIDMLLARFVDIPFPIAFSRERADFV